MAEAPTKPAITHSFFLVTQSTLLRVGGTGGRFGSAEAMTSGRISGALDLVLVQERGRGCRRAHRAERAMGPRLRRRRRGSRHPEALAVLGGRLPSAVL